MTEMKGLFDLAGETPAQWTLGAYKAALMQLATVMRVFNMLPSANEAWDRLDVTLDSLEAPQTDDEVDDQLSRLYALHKHAWEATAEAAAAAAVARGCPGADE